jgi:hypothetical protein
VEGVNSCGISLLSTSYKISTNLLLSRLSPNRGEIIEDHHVGLEVDQISRSDFLHSSDAGEKKWEYNATVHLLFIDFKKAYDLVRMEVLHNILIEFGAPMKCVRPIKMCLNEAYNKYHKDKHLSDDFPTESS